MKKILMMLLSVAFATCAMADSGDIYSILPVGDSGHTYKAGEAVQFVVRLLARNYNEESPNPFLLDYIGSNFEEDDVSNPPMLGIVVSGQLRGAKIVYVMPAKIRKGEDILTPYTDLICEYVVQPGDIASPIKLALNGSTENDPIIPEGEHDVNNSGYILLNGDKWQIVDRREGSRAKLWFTEGRNVRSAEELWGFEVLGPSKFDHDLARANFQVNAPLPKTTVDEIIEGEDWTKFDVAYTLDNLEAGVDYKVIFDVTAGGVTKSITNATAIVNGSFTNTVDTVELFGGKVVDEEAKVVLSLEADGAVVSSSTAKTVVLLPPPGDIHSITRIQSDYKNVYVAGDKVRFRVRLLARDYDTLNPTAYQLVYTGSGTEAEDKVSNPPMLVIVVSGQLRGAKIVEVKPAALEIGGGQTVNPYTDLICEYVVQPSDKAWPIKLAINGSTENNPIIPEGVDAVNRSGYILLNSDKWDIRIKGQSTSANLGFVSNDAQMDAYYFWKGYPFYRELDPGSQDYDLYGASFLVDAQDLIEYVTWDADAKALVTTNITSYTVVTAENAAETFNFEDGKWYVVTNTVERGQIVVWSGKEPAHLILCDGASLKVTGRDGWAGISVSEEGALTIYGQSEGTGTLIAIGGTDSGSGRPGIGGGGDASGKITINGGTVRAYGGPGSAGIGGEFSGGSGATVTINGGTVEVYGGEDAPWTSGEHAAAIGAGQDSRGNHGTVKFGEGVELSVYAGDDEASAEEVTMDNFEKNHSARFVAINREPLVYLTWDDEKKELAEANSFVYEVVTKDTAKFEDGKWYAVTNTVECGSITVEGAAHLILCDDASLTVTGAADYEAGIEVSEGKALTIYGQSEGTGTLVAKGGMMSAGIGGGCDNGGTVTINGGTITTTGGMMAAGIGGAVACKGGMVTINGGTITATGNDNSAGIGGAVAPGGKADDGTVSFGEGVEFSIVAGDDEASATATTVADYTANHSAAYVKIVQGLFPKVTVDEIVEGEDWTKFDVAYTLDNLEEGVDYKVIIDVTAGGVTKSITNATDIVIGSFTNSVDTVKLFGSKVFDEKAKVKVTLGTWKELKWTQLWEKGPYFAEYNVGATKPEDAGKTYTFDELEGLVKAPMRVPTKDDVSKLEFQRNTVKVTWDAAKNGATVTGIGDYASNSIFLPVAANYWTSTSYNLASGDERANFFSVGNNDNDYYVTGGSALLTKKLLVRAVVDPKDVDSVKYIFDPVSTAEKTVELLAPPVEYLDWTGTEFVTATNRTYDVVTAQTKTFEKGWYIVDTDVECGSITVNGEAHLILCDGAKLKVTGAATKAGIEVPADKSLTIYGQSEGTGKLEASSAMLGAGIGGSSQGSCGAITINGGTIKATGGAGGAGIGGGDRGKCGTVTINGGEITASTEYADAIGSGFNAKEAATVIFGSAMASKYVWAGASATACEGMTTTAFATNHSASYVELPVETYEVAYDANGATGTMSNSVFAVTKEVTLKKNAFTALGYDFAGWTTNGTDVVYADEAKDTDFATTNATLSLYAKWELDSNGVTATDFTSLTNLIAQAATQGANLPITIDFTSEVEIPEGATLPTLPTGTGFDGIKYLGDEEGGSNLYIEDGVLYGSAMRGEVTVDALRLMQHAMGSSISSFQAISEGETTVTNAVVMLLGDDGKAYFNDTDDVDEMITDILAADPRPTTVKLYEVKGAIVTFEAMGGTIGSGTDPLGNNYDGGVERITYLCMPDSGYELPGEVTREGYELKGWYLDWKNDTDKIEDEQEIENYSEHSLYAQWTSTAPVESEEGDLHFADLDEADNPKREIGEKSFATNKTLKVVTTPIYLEKIGQRAFTGCETIEKLTLTATLDYDTLAPTTLKIEPMAFAGCKSLKELTIGGDVEIGISAFQNCTMLEKIVFRGEDALTCDASAFVYAGTKNGKGEIKLYMTKAFQANNTELVNNLMTYNNGIVKVDVVPVEELGEIEIPDGSVIVPGKPLAFFVKTSAAGTPDVDSVDIEFSTDLTTWTKLTEKTEKIAYPDGTIMIEVTVPEGSSGFFKAVLNTQQD